MFLVSRKTDKKQSIYWQLVTFRVTREALLLLL